MRSVAVPAALVLALVAVAAQAQTVNNNCPKGTKVQNAALSTLLSGNTVCVGAPGAWKNQEEHMAGGALWDYKRGPGHAVDPRKQIGTWAVSGNGGGTTVTYTYGATTYSYNVCQNSATSVTFVGAATFDATVKQGTGAPCP